MISRAVIVLFGIHHVSGTIKIIDMIIDSV